MKKLLFLMLLISSNAYAGISVCDDGSGKVAHFSLRGNPIQGCHYYDHGQNITAMEYQQISNLLKSVEQRYLKIVNDVPVEMSPAEKTAVDDAIASEITANIRTDAKNQVSGFSGVPLYQRALADITKDEINLLRQWIESFKAQVALASSLADLKTRVAGLPAMPDRTLTQLKTAIQNRVDSGIVDN